MDTTGRGGTEKLMIIVPAAVLVFVIVVVTGGPEQFIRVANHEIRQVYEAVRAWIGI